jgi:hypothetical protein
MHEAFLMEKANIKVVGGPVDLNTAAVTGARVSMKNVRRLAFIIAMGDSTGATASFSLKQHNAASAGTTKALEVTNPYYTKIAGETAFTKTAVDAAEDTYDLSARFAADEGVAVFEVLAEDLDRDGGFTHVSLDVADSAAAKIGVVLAVAHSSELPAYELDI